MDRGSTHKTANRAKGNIGESVACIFLERKGYRIIRRNYRKPWGEIDIIAEKSGVVRFVEVKSTILSELENVAREPNSYRPEELVDERKIAKISRVADFYMREAVDNRDYQIDVVAVHLDPGHKKAKCRLIEGVL